jgi:hypothetical protein
MKLIHLPTGEETEHPNYAAELLLAQYPAEYIRAKLPEYWRVEGYDKSWEYMEGINKEKPTKNWEWVSNKSIHGPTFVNGFDSDTIWPKKLPKISRAEFELHIYNPWKRVKDEMAQLEKDMSGVFKNGIKYITVAPIEAPIEPKSNTSSSKPKRWAMSW